MAKKQHPYHQGPHTGATPVAVNPLIWPAADPDIAQKRKLICPEGSMGLLILIR